MPLQARWNFSFLPWPPFPLFPSIGFGFQSELWSGTSSVLLSFALPLISLSPLLLLIELHPGTTFSRWLVECIKLSWDDFLRVGPVRTHDTRSLSTSWALFNGAPLEQILKATFWSNSNIFILRMSSPMKPLSRLRLWVSRARALRVPCRFPSVPQ